MTNLYISSQTPISNSPEDFEKLEWMLVGGMVDPTLGEVTDIEESEE